MLSGFLVKVCTAFGYGKPEPQLMETALTPLVSAG